MTLVNLIEKYDFIISYNLDQNTKYLIIALNIFYQYFPYSKLQAVKVSSSDLFDVI